ncbi:GGDEF domain-containing protein [Labedaea rhizosphaerae]|uniref:Diguanylate cyclase (GGDEF)-like protein n=1 Tax=Labedaea rhizosphaerae TaxID=598644 RepID=A0A4R6SNQ0_LABRH|nr:GGDEF domain-containing protein [Labedaea rhizosphaerae]TDQ05210.1 diguanylate cyclase (GGDEF)-like protein [Labedaea rhizosphaerae]
MTEVGTVPSATGQLGVLVCDRDGAVVGANAQAARLLGVSAAHLVENTRPPGWHAVEPTGTPALPLVGVVRQAVRTGVRVMRPLVVADDVERRSLLMVITPNADGAVVEVRGVQADLRESAGLLDPLTGLPNAVLLGDRLAQAVTRARTLGGLVSVVLADVRGLADLTATHGVAHADALLAGFGTRLRRDLRADHTVARYGGGTFAVVAEHDHSTGAATAARVRALAGDVAVRIGWATSDGGVPGHELLARAEAALRA